MITDQNILKSSGEVDRCVLLDELANAHRAHPLVDLVVMVVIKKGLLIIIKPAREAFTGRRNSHSGRGEDFLTGQPNFFTETAVTPEQKVKKWFPTWEINRHAEG